MQIANTNQMNAMDNMNGMEGMSGMQMSMMSLNWNTHCVVFLFQSLHAKTQIQFWIGCLVTAVICAIVQFLHLPCVKQFIIGSDPYSAKRKVRRTLQLITYFQSNPQSDRNKFSEKSDQQGEQKILVHKQSQHKIKIFSKLRYLTYQISASLISLLLMLLAMTMNCYIILSICIGVGFGKLVNQQIKLIQNKSSSKKQKQDQTPKQDLKEVQNYCQI